MQSGIWQAKEKIIVRSLEEIEANEKELAAEKK